MYVENFIKSGRELNQEWFYFDKASINLYYDQKRKARICPII